jgi:ankyrin repeat protein
LLKIVSEFNIPDEGKSNVLCYASHTGSRDIVKALIQAGTDINAHTAKRETAPHFASKKGHIKIVELLIKDDAKINIQNESGHSALILADKNDSGC